MTKPEAKSSAMPAAPAKDVPATRRLGIGHLDIPSSFVIPHEQRAYRKHQSS
jgi:hypothetical protein